MSDLPILGITMGDICGCGPEICIKALTNQQIYAICRPVIIGCADAVARAAGIVGAEKFAVNRIDKIQNAKFTYGTIDVYHLPLDTDIASVPFGQVTVTGGRAAFEAVVTAISLAMADEIDGTITGPLNKEAMNLAGYHYSGHTEIYAEYTGTKDYAMMLADDMLRVVHVSTHVPLREACDRVKKDRVYRCIHIAQNACKAIGIDKPRIAVAGLNPHAGENGMFGREEIEEIAPAVEAAHADGLTVDGPLPPDSVFSKARGGMYDIVVAMYHDQGHIPLKVTGFVHNEEEKRWNSVRGVNITLGLPIVRVSVDHGTAFVRCGCWPSLPRERWRRGWTCPANAPGCC